MRRRGGRRGRCRFRGSRGEGGVRPAAAAVARPMRGRSLAPSVKGVLESSRKAGWSQTAVVKRHIGVKQRGKLVTSREAGVNQRGGLVSRYVRVKQSGGKVSIREAGSCYAERPPGVTQRSYCQQERHVGVKKRCRLMSQACCSQAEWPAVVKQRDTCEVREGVLSGSNKKLNPSLRPSDGVSLLTCAHCGR